ncbi:MAG: leucine-rich repeat domain-containing protein [Odoribacteraceae bacterium]|nr:leucine-rich repeat domain-containing protein [Odoribacteraceae bacterium]
MDDFKRSRAGEHFTAPATPDNRQPGRSPRKKSPVYAFSEDNAVLTLFSRFPRDKNLEGLNSVRVPELADVAASVTTLVIEGSDVTEAQVYGIKSIRDDLLTGLSRVSLPDFTGEIPKDAFAKTPFFNINAWLEYFSAPLASGVGKNAFRRCERLATVDISSATTIRYNAFYYCTALINIHLPAAETIGYNAFGYCTALTNVSLPVAETIWYNAFCYCTALINVHLPVAETIEENAFGYCSALTNVSLPVAETIGYNAFCYCTTLTNVHLPVAKTIKYEAFCNCPALTDVYLPAARIIETYAFSDCGKISVLKLGCPGVITLETSMFGEDEDSVASKVDLYLHPSRIPSSGTAYGGYTWKSISPYVPEP